MDDFAAMQAKAKQLVMIYKPTHKSVTGSASLLGHTAPPNPANKGTQNQDQLNQHQLTPIQHQNQQQGGNNSAGTGRGQGQNRGRGGPQVIIILTIVIMITTIGEETRVVPLEETIMANKGIEILSTMVRIGKIDSGEIKTDKVGAIITGIMTAKASMD